MGVSSRVTSLQSYHLLLFRTALHPEFFEIEGRRRIAHGEYEFEGWVFEGGHVLRFEHNGLCATEVVTSEPDLLPDRGLVTSVPCAGERDQSSEFSDRIGYVSSIQTETLTDHLYLSTYNELRDHGLEDDAVMSVWEDDAGKPNLSMVVAQRLCDQIHLQCYHLRSDCGLVLRTQSIFELISEDAATELV